MTLLRPSLRTCRSWFMVALLVLPAGTGEAQTNPGALPDGGDAVVQLDRKPPEVTARALALMNGAVRRLQRATTFTASTERRMSVLQTPVGSGMVFKIWARRPGDALIELTRRSSQDQGDEVVTVQTHLVRDDSTYLQYNKSMQGDSVLYSSATQIPAQLGVWSELAMAGDQFCPFGPFFRSYGDQAIGKFEWLPVRRHDPTLYELVDEGTTEWEGKKVEVVRWVKLQWAGFAPPGTTESLQEALVDTVRYYISTDPDTVIRHVTSSNSIGHRTEITITDFRFDDPIRDSVFAWTPPADVEVKKQGFAGNSGGVAESDPEETLPGFAVAALDGDGELKAVTLESALAGNQALLLWLWNTQ